jgi:F-type H+-transporting ATPase subunit alpha
MEILKQGQYAPIPVGLQIVSIFAGTKGFLDRLKVSAIGAFEPNLHRYVQDNGAQTIDRIIDTGELDDQAAEELSNLITAAVDLYLKENPEAALA